MDELVKTVESLKDRRFILIRPGGNWGDHLIWLGFENLADQMGIRWVTYNVEDFDPSYANEDDVIFVHGSGGFTELASGRALRALELSTSSSCHKIIYGPSTIHDEYQMQKILEVGNKTLSNGRLVLFVRENTSLGIARKFTESDGINISRDAAFYVDIDQLRRRVGPIRAKFNLFAIRQDRESSNGNRMPPAKFGVICIDPAAYAKSFDHWLRIHFMAINITTNRTHSAILGSILNKDTHFFDGAYHKNRSIWEYCLRDRGVTWIDAENAPQKAPIFPILSIIPYKKIRESHKIKALVRKAYGLPQN